MTLETHFRIYWTILEKLIFLALKIGQNEWFTVKMAPSGGSKKTKNRSKYTGFWYLRLKIGFYFTLGHFPSHTVGISPISRKTKKIERFFGKKERFGLKLGVFVKKSKKRSKNRVFDFFELKIGFSITPVDFQSIAAGIGLISWKTKKLGRFFVKNGRFLVFGLKSGDFVKKSKNRSKNRVFRF